jgi:hypothetical protein
LLPRDELSSYEYPEPDSMVTALAEAREDEMYLYDPFKVIAITTRSPSIRTLPRDRVRREKKRKDPDLQMGQGTSQWEADWPSLEDFEASSRRIMKTAETSSRLSTFTLFKILLLLLRFRASEVPQETVKPGRTRGRGSCRSSSRIGKLVISDRKQ